MRKRIQEKLIASVAEGLSRMSVGVKLSALMTVFFGLLLFLALAVDGLVRGTPDWVAGPGAIGGLGMLASIVLWVSTSRSAQRQADHARQQEEAASKEATRRETARQWVARREAAYQEEARRHPEPAEPRRRKRVSREIREAVFRRDGGRCVECGDDFDIQYDHVIPWSMGGADSVENLQLLCSRCNQRKGNRHVH